MKLPSEIEIETERQRAVVHSMDPFDSEQPFYRTATAPASYYTGSVRSSSTNTNGGGGGGGGGREFPMLAQKLQRMENFDFSATPPRAPSPPPPSLYFDNNSSISSRSSMADPLDLNVAQLFYQICKVNKEYKGICIRLTAIEFMGKVRIFTRKTWDVIFFFLCGDMILLRPLS